MREKNRYIVFALISDTKQDKDIVSNAIYRNASKLLGETGFAQSGLWVMEFDKALQKGLLRVNHKSVGRIRASLALIQEVDNAPVIFHVHGVSGTIKQARAKWM